MILYEMYDYQKDCANAIYRAIRAGDKFILAQLATGGGKTIIFAHLIKLFIQRNPKTRILVLAHRSKLIDQAKDKILKVWPDATIGTYCSSLSSKKDSSCPITIASRQTIVNSVEELKPFDLTIIDEVHMVTAANNKSEYTTIIKALSELNPRHVTLGVTATPWRLGHGYIYGDQKRPDKDNYFDKLVYSKKTDDLVKLNRLSKYKIIAPDKDINKDLEQVAVRGEFNNKQLTNVMIRKQHIKSVPESLLSHAEGRKKIAAFCVSIEHIENVAKELDRRDDHKNFSYAVYHSKQKKDVNNAELRRFESGEARILLSIDMLTEGYDNDEIDCLIDISSTMSSAKWLQRLGRGLRWHKDKKDCLIIDLAGNIWRHLSVNDPSVKVPGIPGEGKAPFKLCPECKYINNASALKCGNKEASCKYEYPMIIKQYVTSFELKEYLTPEEKKKVKPASRVMNLFRTGTTMRLHTSTSKNKIISLHLFNSSFGERPEHITEFLDFSNNLHFMTIKSRKIWASLVGNTPPNSNADAIRRRQELFDTLPQSIEIKRKKKEGTSKSFWNVVYWGVSPWNK